MASSSSSNSTSSSPSSPSSSPTSSPSYYSDSSSFPPPIYGIGTAADSNGAQYNGRIIAVSLAMLCCVLLFILALHVYAKWSWGGSAGARRRTHDHRSASSSSSSSSSSASSSSGSSSRYSSGSLLYAHDRRPAAAGGLDRLAIGSLPSFVYNSCCTATAQIYGSGTWAAAAARRECAVCLSEFHDGDGCRALPKCRHSFHAACIDKWLSSHTTCPLCRADVAATVAVEPSGRRGSAHPHDDANVVRPDNDARDWTMATGVDFVGPRTLALSSAAGLGHTFSVQAAEDSDYNTVRPSAALASPGWGWTRSISDRFRLHPTVQFPTNVLFWGDHVHTSLSSHTDSSAAAAPPHPPLHQLIQLHPPPHRPSPSDPHPSPSSRGPVIAPDSCTAAAHLHHHRSSSFGGSSSSSSSASSGPIGGSQLHAFKRLLFRDKKIRVFPTQQQQQGQEQDEEVGHDEEGTSDASSS